ncbi:ribonuclease H2, subunit C [Baffinella frigidus]|nr:ribonuclease H2, subunit C [Cryptophyta sp. CCMP2293]
MSTAGSLLVREGIGEVKVHNIPTKTTFCGPAEVQSYFQPTQDPSCKASPDGKEVLLSSFRGRTLRGAEIPLPEGYSGYAIRPVCAGPEGLDGGEELEAVHRFTHVTAWNHDVKPAASDYFPALVDWSSLAAVLHGTRPEA